MELWFNDFQNSTSLLAILKIIPGCDHAWPARMSPTGHSSQQSMETGWTPPVDSWSQGVCSSPYLLGAGSVKLGCLAQTPASWGLSVMNWSIHLCDLVPNSYKLPLNVKQIMSWWPYLGSISTNIICPWYMIYCSITKCYWRKVL